MILLATLLSCTTVQDIERRVLSNEQLSYKQQYEIILELDTASGNKCGLRYPNLG